MIDIQGEVANGFERVKDAFAANFDKHGDVGAAFALYHRGQKVVDVWAGVADDETGRPWAEDSLQLVFSTTKGATAVCANLLAQRGELDLDAPVVTYWPEFGAEGKENIPVRWLLSHRAGLPVVDNAPSPEEALAWDPMIKLLSAQAPVWEPGTAHGYHALTYGWLVGEVVRRISGKSLGTFFADEVAGPLGLDFWIGLPASQESRVSPLIQGGFGTTPDIDIEALPEEIREIAAAFISPDSLVNRALFVTNPRLEFNSPEVHAAEIPAANGITDARSLARMYAGLVGNGVDGVRLFTDETVANATTEQSNGPDKVLFAPTRFGLGFFMDSTFAPLGGPKNFGHAGAGGSLGFADPDKDLGFGYVMNKMETGLAGDPRTLGLIAAVYASVD
ncbi:MAG TPA: serine hydrolase domain-containing protein [Acidimicrobiales bacterium]|nr:serine hydrolase domain-containing protein [Acidimicrobiales bacterium]